MPESVPPGAIILLNGASSSGKTTLARGLQAVLEIPFWHYSIDHLRAAKVLPGDRIESGEFPWKGLREAFFAGFHATIPAFAGAGNNLIVEHIVETETWMHRLRDLLHGLDVFFVGLHCPLPELERRELERSDRKLGEARADFETAHRFSICDFEAETTLPIEQSVIRVAQAWRSRTRPSAFERMGNDR